MITQNVIIPVNNQTVAIIITIKVITAIGQRENILILNQTMQSGTNKSKV